MKICTICNIEKPLTEFHVRNLSKGTYQSTCKSCRKTIDKEYYNKDKSKKYKGNEARRKLIREWINDYKRNVKCSICSESHIACLTFHHSNPKNKEFGIGDSNGYGRSIESIKKEIEKCIVLCANCHMKLHYEQRELAQSVER